MARAHLEQAMRSKLERGNPSAYGSSWERERNASMATYSEGCYRYTFDGEEEPAITINEDHYELGHRVWDTCTLMCKYFEHNAGIIAGKTVVEVGAGTGLLGLVLSRLGAARVTMTEYGPCLMHLQENIDANAQGIADSGASARTMVPTSCLLDWNDEELPAEVTADPANIVLAADITVFPDTVGKIVDLLKRLAALRSDVIVIIGCQMRREAHDGFVDLASQSFRVQVIPQDSLHPDYRTDRHVLFQMTLR